MRAVVELRARFDEANNIEWSRRLEEAGVHVVYGLVGYKIHCKTTLVVRRDPDCPACADESRVPELVEYDDACRPAPTVAR